MREIKFRAYYLTQEEKAVHDKAYAEWSTNWEGCSLGYVLDDPDYAVVQYTGLKDKNGVEIYDGDIITLIDLSSDYAEKVSRDKFGAFIVEWAEHLSGWYPKSLNGYEPDETWWDSWEIEVIGNSYENPELLEAKS